MNELRKRAKAALKELRETMTPERFVQEHMDLVLPSFDDSPRIGLIKSSERREYSFGEMVKIVNLKQVNVDNLLKRALVTQRSSYAHVITAAHFDMENLQSVRSIARVDFVNQPKKSKFFKGIFNREKSDIENFSEHYRAVTH